MVLYICNHFSDVSRLSVKRFRRRRASSRTDKAEDRCIALVQFKRKSFSRGDLVTVQSFQTLDA